ncbi:molybdopterin-dependent oxidoreductase [Methylocella sp.]|uniref:molybdopterin-dependent oxidoreductase n=1 Tax=Methylocella sp. TaxID=1978226 RepID=UPI003782FB02
MDRGDDYGLRVTRRRILKGGGALGALLGAGAPWAFAAGEINLGFSGGPSLRPTTGAFPQKGEMILQRTRPPLLETPFSVFNQGVFTPNDQFFVRWHWSAIPPVVDPAVFRLAVSGHVETPLSLSLDDLLAMPRFEIAAVNQCSGNSRGRFSPRVPGAQWGDGAMGNARWLGVRLTDVLDKAGVRAGAQRVRFGGLDEATVEGAPKFKKSIPVDRARDGETMIAFAMNGEPLPFLNGYPLRLVVPGWYSTYWVKMLNTIEVLDGPDDNFWTAKAYMIPDTPGADVTPGQTGFKTVPISRMAPRSFLTNFKDGDAVPANRPTLLRGFAFGGDSGVKSVDVSLDGASWRPAALERDEGAYSFRRWSATIAPPAGKVAVMVRCVNADGIAQPMTANWNPGGFMRNVVETTRLNATVA